MSNKKIELELLSCPGDTLKEIMEDRGWNVRMLAERLGLSGNMTWRLLKGDKKITQDLAGKLEEVTKVPKEFWVNREKLYREKLSKIRML